MRGDPSQEETREAIAMTNLSAGAAPPEIRVSGKGRLYEDNAYHVAQGKKHYSSFNCAGCHGHGGGGSGPPLMDAAWIYGGSIENIVRTIQEGRPNGMPSFRGRIAEEQIWQLAAYVRSMGRHVRKDVAPSRNDDMQARPAENALPRAEPAPAASVPPAAERPQ
ncbi:MAG TPA: c-type cytochrome [Beijerinckiaceae bacterium]